MKGKPGRRCAQCRARFVPRASTLQTTCSPACALAWVRARPDRLDALRRRAEAKERREYRERTETPSQAATLAQTRFNQWIRWRDSELGCVSCGHPNDGSRQRVAGHYRPAGSNPALRYHEDNVHGQCGRCNTHLSANLAGYRVELVRRIGLARVEWLEGPHELPKRTREDFRAVEREYTRRLADLRRGRAA